MEKLYKRQIYLIIFILFVSSCSSTQTSKVEEKLSDLKKSNVAELSTKYESPYFNDKLNSNLSLEFLEHWWTALNDETLNSLITLSLDNNKDLQVAISRVNQARAELGINKSKWLPWIESNSTWKTVKGLENPSSKGDAINTYRLGIDSSWEIDIFGGNNYKVEASKSNLKAQQSQFHATQVTLISEIAINYISLRSLQERLDNYETDLELQEQSIKLLQSRYDAGLMNESKLNQAKNVANQIKFNISSIKIDIEEFMNNLALLTGQVPGKLESLLSENKKIPSINEMIYVGIPADALRQRPDIQAAEYQLESQLAKTESAKSELKPKLVLAGSIGLENVAGESLLSAIIGYSLLPKISIPIFNAGAIKKNIQVQSEKENEYLAIYENKILIAVAEVRNSLTAVTQESEKNIYLKESIKNAEFNVEISKERYNSGLDNFQSVIDSQRALLSLQDQYINSEGQKIINLIGLFKSLGGGWKPLINNEVNTNHKN